MQFHEFRDSAFYRLPDGSLVLALKNSGSVDLRGCDSPDRWVVHPDGKVFPCAGPATSFLPSAACDLAQVVECDDLTTETLRRKFIESRADLERNVFEAVGSLVRTVVPPAHLAAAFDREFQEFEEFHAVWQSGPPPPPWGPTEIGVVMVLTYFLRMAVDELNLPDAGQSLAGAMEGLGELERMQKWLTEA